MGARQAEEIKTISIWREAVTIGPQDFAEFLMARYRERQKTIGLQLGLGQYKSEAIARMWSGQYSMLNEMITQMPKDLKDFLHQIDLED